MTMQDAIAEIEVKMAGLKAEIDAKNASLAPLRAELDALNAEEQALRARVAAKVAEINAARGDAAAWVELKRKLGVLASTRMQMRAALKAL